MKTYLALISLDLRLALRQKSVIFFNYLLPLVFFFIFAKAMHAERGAQITQVIAMVTVIGTLGSGLFGAGMRAVMEREMNILRRYKVTPISPLPLLVASVLTGWILFMPNILLLLALAHFMYGMPWPVAFASLFIFISLGIAAFRAIGLILASIANSTQESQILIQLTYLPMLFLSGATFPTTMFPTWLLILSQFIPTKYLVDGVQGMLLSGKTLADNLESVGALLLTAAVGLFIALKLFRWEKDEKVRTSSKFWILAAMVPFLVVGAKEARTKTGISEAKILARKVARGETYLLRNARIFIGDGKVIENGSVLVRGGKIAGVYEGDGPDPESLKADVMGAAGKTILPGLIDVHVHLGAMGGFPASEKDDEKDYDPHKVLLHNLAAYLYSGVTTVRSTGDILDSVLQIRSTIARGETLGAEVQTCGPLFTAAGGHGTEYFKQVPEAARDALLKQFNRIPKSAEEARQQVDALKTDRVDCIKAILESGAASRVFNRLDTNLFAAVAQEAHAQGLPLAVHTGDARDVTDAVQAKADSIEHGSFREAIPDALFEQMKTQGIFYDPTLSVVEGLHDFGAGKNELLKRSLVQQVASAELLKGTEAALTSSDMQEMRSGFAKYPFSMPIAIDNLKRAWQHGVALVTGSDAGNFLVIHGPTVQHEMALWVQAGIPPAVALQAATYNAARLLKADDHIGSIRVGNDADLLVVDGNPLEDISVTERISWVIFKGERVYNRAGLFAQE
jgi:imidazolonepropionase-like amidohydrolase/ABC-type multidrug transport system permease subunit